MVSGAVLSMTYDALMTILTRDVRPRLDYCLMSFVPHSKKWMVWNATRNVEQWDWAAIDGVTMKETRRKNASRFDALCSDDCGHMFLSYIGLRKVH
jgi:hypothetical protein